MDGGSGEIRFFHLNEGLPPIDRIRMELRDYTDVLLGRIEPPIDNGIMTLMEVANAYFSRAKELEMIIHEAEADGRVLKNSAYYKLRTGELRDFIELAKGAVELGSRRITAAQIDWEMRHG